MLLSLKTKHFHVLFPKLAHFYFRSWRISVSSVGDFSLPQLAELFFVLA